MTAVEVQSTSETEMQSTSSRVQADRLLNGISWLDRDGPRPDEADLYLERISNRSNAE